MKICQVAAQLYTVRDYTKTPHELAETLKKIRSIGYQAVQVSTIGPIENKELARILDGEGLVCCITHEKANEILNDPQKVIDKLCAIHCKYTAYPYPHQVDLTSAVAVSKLASDLQNIGKMLAYAGLSLAYHNHQLEFRKINGRPILEKIYAETAAEFLKAEPDTYWIQISGADAVDWCRRLNGRMPAIHLKDCMIDNENKTAITHVGNGNLDWVSIVAAAEKSGCEWFVVEQDGNWINNDPFEALTRSFEYLRDNVCTQNNHHIHSSNCFVDYKQ